MKKVLLILVLIILRVFGYYYFTYLNKNDITLKDEIVVSLNEEVYNLDNIYEEKRETIVTENELLDTSKIGTYKVIIEFKDSFGKVKEVSYSLKVIDNKAPVITFNDKITTNKAVEVDLLKDVKVIDDSKEDITVSVVGDYDINKIGTYELYYVAKDSSGNEAKEKFILEVLEIITIGSNTGTPTDYFTTSKGYNGYSLNGITYIDGILVANKTYALPSTYNPGGLTEETVSNMDKMFADAKSIGLNIYLSSGFRSYETQKWLYNNYVSYDGKEAADTYSARAGHSEHQTGLAFDVNQVDNTFDDTPDAKWLHENCYKYGFILRYPKGKTNETGYIYESWHFRYVGNDLAYKLYNDGNWITLEDYFGITSSYSY